MKSITFATVFTLVATVSAQTIDTSMIPSCAQSCVVTAAIAASSGCPAFLSEFESCIKKSSCSQTDQALILGAVSGICSMSSFPTGIPTGIPTGTLTGSETPSTTHSATGTTHSTTGTASATRSAPAASSSVSFDISKIPACASGCAIGAFGSTTCSTTDFECICKDKKFISSLEPCIAKECDKADQNTMLSAAASLCGAYGVPIASITASTPISTTGTAANGTVAHTTSTVTSTKAIVYTNSTMTTVSSTSSESSSSSTLTTTTESTTTRGTTTTSSSTSTSTGGAVRMAGSGFAAAAMGVAWLVL